MGQHRKNIVKLLNDNAGTRSTRDVFHDFIALTAIALSNAVDQPNFEAREADYMRIIKGYTKEEAYRFHQMYGELILEFEEVEFDDVLGKLYMEIDGGNDRTGQFFTPYDICRMMAKFVIGDAHELLEARNYITINEPACGAAAMLIAYAEELKNLGINPQQKMLATCVDVDIKCVHMAYIQLSLLGIPAVIIHGNTLTLEEWGHWKTPFYIMGGFWYRKQMKDISFVNEAEIIEPPTEPPPKEPLLIDIGEQMSLPFFM